ncbi:hypothetical protein PIB30_030226 [Stylosanthes scabra]|uniref:Uncharacterized protein n=1 Tax=Stylosanthes scabra TaxID=79078 RepID=A0ABU6VAE5_9FABA|nr:hypothetical protein [Stylosanthes scabra]
MLRNNSKQRPLPHLLPASPSSMPRHSTRHQGRDKTSSIASTVRNVGHVYALIDREPSLRRSGSMAIPFLRSRSRFYGGADLDLDSGEDSLPMNGSRSARLFWSLFRSYKNEKEHDNEAKAALAV